MGAYQSAGELESAAASFLDLLNTCLREAGLDDCQVGCLDLHAAKRSLVTLIGAERSRAAQKAEDEWDPEEWDAEALAESAAGVLADLHEALHAAQGHPGPAGSCYATLLCQQAADARRGR